MRWSILLGGLLALVPSVSPPLAAITVPQLLAAIRAKAGTL